MNMAGTSYWENEDNQNEEDQLEIDEEDENDSYALPGQLRGKNVNGEDVERGGDESEEEEEEEEEEYCMFFLRGGSNCSIIGRRE